MVELLLMTGNFDFPESFQNNQHRLTDYVLYGSKHSWQLTLWIIGSCFFLLSPECHLIQKRWKKCTVNFSPIQPIILQLTAFISFFLLTAVIFDQLSGNIQISIFTLFSWLTLAALVFILWLYCIAPLRFWQNIIGRFRTKLLFAVLLGLTGWQLMGMFQRQEAPLAQQTLWSNLSALTLSLSNWLISLIYPDLIFDPDQHLVGTERYPVEITYKCSGIEGISLIVIFLSLYLWLFRKDLRFPYVLLLYPIGIIAIWLANSIRIVLLVIVGTSYSPDVASLGFHAQAGWIMFTLIALAAIYLTHQIGFFRNDYAAKLTQSRDSPNLATALLLPFLVQLALVMVTSALSSGFDAFYPLKIVIILLVLYQYKIVYRTFDWGWSWLSLIVGAIVFFIWIWLTPQDIQAAHKISTSLANHSSLFSNLWLIFRIFGSVFVIPFTEELAFRAYLMRKLIYSEFENVRVGQFTWLSFLSSSLCFGLLHTSWIAGTIAGMAYAIILYKRSKLCDAIYAHMITNAFIAGYVLFSGKWYLWA
jgi:exosortase E/protease (VPEID-CTERM system)